MPTTIVTTDQDKIKAFAAARAGVPAMIDQVKDGYHSQPLVIYFEERESDMTFDVKPVSWKIFFVEMNNRELALAYEEDGDDRYYYEFVPAH